MENYIEKKNEPALDSLVQEFRAHYISHPLTSRIELGLASELSP
ncbi:hypothetical protein [Bradyrhizobium sp. Ec3.3]|nr:hypothetical protein [Bradyrhizobium sp. Ec3.3]